MREGIQSCKGFSFFYVFGIFFYFLSFQHLASGFPEDLKGSIESLKRVSMVFDGGSIRFDFLCHDASPLIVIISDQNVLKEQGVSENPKEQNVYILENKEKIYVRHGSVKEQRLIALLRQFEKNLSGHPPDKTIKNLIRVIQDRSVPPISAEVWVSGE